MIGLIGAMAVEVEALEKKLEGRRETTIGMDTFVSGKLFGQMILQLPEDHLQQEKAIYFLQNKGLRVEEVTDRVHG